MKIKNIKINNYGNLENKEINLNKKINIIYGKNESGKSTLLNYIKNIFYGISKNKNGKNISDYEKYKPWNREEFSGKLKYELDNGEEFEVYKDFNKKNPKIYNSDLEDITDQFNVVKKDGVQFFYDQTGVDETMFTSTVVSMQEEVKLDRQEQNVLVQKLSNLAGTGDDGISYKKLIDKLNKLQIEEVGSDRSQGRPINIVKDKLNKLNIVLKDIHEYQKDKDELSNKKSQYSSEIDKKNNELELYKKLSIISLCKQNEEDKLKIKTEYKNEQNKKIEDLNMEKNKLIEKNKNNFKKIKINFKKYFLILFFILIINLIIFFINNKFLKNNLINIFNCFLIPIYFLIIFIYEKNKIIKNKKNNNIEKEKINNEINLLNKQINYLTEEKNKEEKIIENEQIEIDNNFEIELEKIKKDYKDKLDINNYLEKIEKNNINDYIYYTQESLNKLKMDLQAINIEENNLLNKIETLATMQEEYQNLNDKLLELEEKNEEINLTKEFLEKAYINMKNGITPKFTENLSKNISKISNNKYTKVGIDDENGLIVENRLGEYISAERLSVGTIDQLYLSLRLSMIDDLSEERLPVILDEVFAYYDDERLENILKFLNEQISDHQIIIFTCTTREQQILEKLDIDYNLVEM